MNFLFFIGESILKFLVAILFWALFILDKVNENIPNYDIKWLKIFSRKK
jgi:hypothetical protein